MPISLPQVLSISLLITLHILQVHSFTLTFSSNKRLATTTTTPSSRLSRPTVTTTHFSQPEGTVQTKTSEPRLQDKKTSSSSDAVLPQEVQIDPQTQLTLRYLQENDLPRIIQLCIDEYGSQSSSSSLQSTFFPFSAEETTTNNNNNPLQTALEDIFAKYEDWAFGEVVKMGLQQRIKRQNQQPQSPPDHNVICLLRNDIPIGIAELSIQINDPNRTAPSYVLPFRLKQLLAGRKGLVPYISNVLIDDEYRGKGYSKILMKACEDLAVRYGYEDVYLHVDADVRSGMVPRNLYLGLGYKAVMKEYGRMGGELKNQNGVYIVDGAALLYLKKRVEVGGSSVDENT